MPASVLYTAAAAQRLHLAAAILEASQRSNKKARNARRDLITANDLLMSHCPEAESATLTSHQPCSCSVSAHTAKQKASLP